MKKDNKTILCEMQYFQQFFLHTIDLSFLLPSEQFNMKFTTYKNCKKKSTFYFVLEFVLILYNILYNI